MKSSRSEAGSGGGGGAWSVERRVVVIRPCFFKVSSTVSLLAPDGVVRSAVFFQLYLERNDDDRLGALNLYSMRPDAFDDEAVELGEVFAAHCSAVLAAAFERLRQESQQRNIKLRDLARQVVESGDWG